MGLETFERGEWRKLVERSLKGASLDKLVSRNADGLPIQPLYAAAEDDEGAAERLGPGRWRIAQRLDHPDPTQACAQGLADLEGGADELVLVLAGGATGRGFGVEADSTDALDRAFAGVKLDLIQLRLETAPFDRRATMSRLIELLERRKLAPKKLSIDFGLDPISDMARVGGLPLAWPELAERFAGTAKLLIEKGFARRLARVDGRAAHEAGASEAQELAFALATGIAYLRALEGGGLSLDQARQALTFLLVADADQFLTIAKFRAMRRLWAWVEKACGLTPEPIELAVETAWRMTTRRDPHANMLRATLATFSAGVGGADSITILPFTAALGLPDAFARGVARNLHHVLMEESHLWRVAEPAAGSGAFEAMTDALVDKAWTLFQEIEADGGVVESLAAGKLQRRIGVAREARASEIARRKMPITGVSEFALLAEAPVAVLAPAPARLEAVSRYPLARRCEPLAAKRLAEPFERLRDRSDAFLARNGRRPTIFLANLGEAASFTARRLFAKSLFEGGGIETTENDTSAILPGIIDAFRDSGAEVACLCSSDETYARQGAEAAARLKEAGVAKLAIVANPRELAGPLAGAPIDLFVFAGCDVPQTLTRLYDDVFEARS